MKPIVIIAIVFVVLILYPVFIDTVFATHLSFAEVDSYCFRLSNTNWGQIDRCFADARMHNLLSIMTVPLWVIGGIVFVLLTVWLMLRRFKSELKKDIDNNTKPQNDSDETVEELEKKIREIHDKKVDGFKPFVKSGNDKERKKTKPVIIITVSALWAAVVFAAILILNPFGGGFDNIQNNFNEISDSPEMNELNDKPAKLKHPFEIEAIYYDSGYVEISFLDTSGKTYGVSLEILGLDETFQKSFPGSEFIEIVPFPNEPKYGWAMHPIVLEVTHSELGNIQLKTEIHPLDSPIPSVIYSKP